MASSQSKSELEAILNQTEVGAFIFKHMKMIFLTLIIVIVGAIGWGANSYYTSNQNKELSKVVFEFESGDFKNFTDDKMKVEEFMTNFEALQKNAGSFKGMLPFSLSVCDTLIKKGHLDAAKKVLNWSNKEFSSQNEFSNYFILSRLAVVDEDLQKYDEAISSLEKLTSSKTKLLEARTYFDLGRLYLKVGNKEKSKLNFTYVIDNFSDNELAKMAKAYLFKNGLKD